MRRYRSRRQYGTVNYIMPFLILVAVGIILILLYSLWKALFAEDKAQAAYMHVAEGSAQMKTWGTEEFFNISSDALIMEGDEIVSSSNGKLIIEFFDGTIMRIDGGTDIIFEGIDNRDDEASIGITLVDGNVWFNKLYKDTGDTEIDVKMGNIQINADSGSIFEAENSLDDYVRVLKGEDVKVDIYDKDGGKVVESEDVGIGQEALFNDAILDRYWKFQSPNVISALSDGFKQSRWYTWNTTEDSVPTQFEKSVNGQRFVKAEPEELGAEADAEGEISDEDEEPADESGEEVEEPKSIEEIEEDVSEESTESLPDLGELGIPTIITVSGGTEQNADGFYVVKGNPATLRGGATGAAKIIVNGFTLTKFNPGDSEWTYFANADYGLMVEGENVYEVVAEAPDGTMSEPLQVKVFYDPVVEE